MTHPTFAEYLAQLKRAEVLPLPAGEEPWDEHVHWISTEGIIAEISEEQYTYWLEVLPPRLLFGSHFAFAEGEEAFRLFWRDRASGRYYCRQLTHAETLLFCSLARLAPPLL